MNRSLVLIVMVLLCKGVNSLTDQDYEMADKLFSVGAEAFLKVLDNLKTGVELVVKEEKINITGNEMEDLWISVKEVIEFHNAEEKAKGNDDFVVALKTVLSLSGLQSEGYYRLRSACSRSISRKFREFSEFKGIFKNETMVDLWKYVESHYLPGSPSVLTNPVGFLTHLLSKILAQPQIVNILKAAEIFGKTDVNQLFDTVQTSIHLLREKAMEIYNLEKQKEKDEFLITLRTVSGVLAFYWDELLEYTESQPFHDKYLASLSQWKELGMLKNTEKYHVITNPDTGLQAWSWADERFSDLFDNAALEYDRWGNGIFGDDRFNQSNWAIMKMATVYPLPIYQTLSDNGLGMSEVNDFFIDTDDTLTELLGEDILFNLKGVLKELWSIFSNEILHISINKKNQITSDMDHQHPLQHLHKIKATCFDIWDRVLSEINRNINNDGLEQSARHWDEVKSVFVKELTDSGEISQQKLDEAKKAFNSVTQHILDKYIKMIDGLEERITASTETIGKIMLKTFSATNTVLVTSLAFLLSD